MINLQFLPITGDRGSNIPMIVGVCLAAIGLLVVMILLIRMARKQK